MFNVAESLILQTAQDEKDFRKLKQQLNGRFHYLGEKPVPEDEEAAPYWWQGDDEAYEATMSAMSKMPRRGRRRR